MGICTSLDDRQRADRMLNDKLEKDKKSDSLVHKLLLLGAGESGKSTIFRQLSCIYGEGISIEDRRGYVQTVHSNTIQAIKKLCKASIQLAKYGHLKKEPHFTYCEVTDEKTLGYMDEILKLKTLDSHLSESLNGKIKHIWNDVHISHTFQHFRGAQSVPDSAGYFFSRLDETWKKDYLPSIADVLRSRVRTTGIVEQHYRFKESKFHIFDVGGQRNERKKWMHLFSEVTAVLFVASLSAFDQVLYEDSKVNRMEESLCLFEEVCHMKHFHQTNIILFLNKSDLFELKLQRDEIQLADWCPDYRGENDFKSACLFIKEKFLGRNGVDNRKQSQIFTHITNATDTDHVKFVFNACQNIIIHASLNQAGLLMQ
mmetsp:Transcript_19404/g.27320  ORF Transcript_19404/g.27320 Transcript_19404/m.27320 type:complete len:371 (+) Transcript_19404:173-1285(+)|eukprot:CAMPEP_0185263428 /NCGR_PEP_ID=MMETSP1359-20130426/15185_1 /TAXON_ID=552665 /ORGANISM="Bigelowiella longifila, Strain CCMP242" /LENGTH=370 /DNA_ID=CAMNT_0027850967 /DNA_START=132 /DNA_END=1244 /DNA_ORIENTATION=-